jgi:flagellum-specific peptidoglycan hydrolase FlgJ
LRPAPKPRWQQATALVSLGAGGVVTGLSFVPGSPADVTSPATLPFALMALEKSAQQAPSDDAMLRSAIVHVARHFLRMAERKSPAEMEAIIWRHASLDGADHGPSCAAFASLTLELASHVAGHESWVTGGTSYPWPLNAWADARVDPNPASPNVISVLQDAQSHHRWHPLGDGYDPQPGDWVLFDGHVEVVTNDAGGVLHTIGGDSLPNYSVNAHSYPGPLSSQGVAGFVDNGLQPVSAAPSAGQFAAPGGHNGQARQAQSTQAAPKAKPAARAAAAPDRAPATANRARAADNASSAPVTSSEVLAPRAIPAPPTVPESPFVRSRALPESGAQTRPEAAAFQQAAPQARAQDTARVASKPRLPQRHPRGHNIPPGDGVQPARLIHGRESGKADIPATGLRLAAGAPRARPGQAEIPGLFKQATRPAASPSGLAPYQRHQHAPSARPTMPGSAVQRAFIEQVVPGAMATQRKYGVPASVTIAQAIDESGWGQSILATQDHNLFGIKGTGPAGSDLLPTQEFAGGRLVDTTAPFRVYHDIGQSIEAHGKLLARSEYFTNAMANRNQPNAFAAALTGVYATDPGYGTKLIQLMQQYNLYRFDVAARAPSSSRTAPAGSAIPGITGQGSPAQGRPGLATAAQPASGPAAAAQAKLARGRTPNRTPTSSAGPYREPVHAARHASDRGLGDHGGAARQAQRAGSADAGWTPDSAIPGTGYAGPPTGQPSGAARQAAMPGQADIPGLPVTAAARAAHPPHRTRIASGLRPAHPPASGHRSGTAQPVGTAPAAGGYGGSSPRPATPGPAMPQASGPTSHAQPGPMRRAASPSVARVPGLPGGEFGQPAGGPATTTGLGDVAIPGLPPAPAGSTGTAHGAGAVPQDGAVAQDGAWIPGLPGQGSETAGHGGHSTGLVPRGSAPIGAAHGTNLAPTRARRFPSAGQPSAQRGDGGAPANHAPPAGSSPAPAPVSAHRPAAQAAPAAATATATPPPGTSAIPGLPDSGPVAASGTATAPASTASPSGAGGPAPTSGADIPGLAPGEPASAPASSPASGAGTTFGTGQPIPASTTAVTAVRYSRHLPPAVGKAYLTSAKMPLVRGEPLYVDVAGQSGMRWEILAACDWMQCKAKPGLSPVYGEKLGTVNPDGTSYRTRSAALERCAYDLVELARSIYQIDLTRSDPLSVRELANVFAAFRWGGLLKEHHTSAMEFPYSVAGLTTQHMHMRWPNIDDPQAPDKPGARFHQPFGAVPLVLSLNYPATA